jgi:hypothetical protein
MIIIKQKICLLFIVLAMITQITTPCLGHKEITEDHDHFEISPSREMPKPEYRLKYPDTVGTDIVTDAPWRVLRRTNGWVPLLIFVPDVNIDDIDNDNRFRGIEFERITIYEGKNCLYNDSNVEVPSSGGDFVVIDEDGNNVSSNIVGSDIPSGEIGSGIHCDVDKTTDTVGGWHRIIRIPINKLSGRKLVFLKTEIVAKPVYDKKVPEDYIKKNRIFYSRTLRIYISKEPFPSLGNDWHYFDAHNHTIAEWSQGRKLLSPRKAFGGPIQMVKESALAMGLVSLKYKERKQIIDFKDRVIATDHNAFFSDNFVVSVGPSAGKPIDFTWDAECFDTEKGQSEFENLRSVFGNTFGEEVTLKTDFNTDKMNTGTHLILLRGKHVNGPWHGGLLCFDFLGFNFGKLIGGEPNDNSLDDVLSNAASQQTVPFAFAAHPFAKGNHWNMTKKENYMEMLHDRSDRYVTEKGEKKFIFKGAQYWNGKRNFIINADKIKSENTDKYITRYWNIDFFDLHPFSGAPRTPPPTDDMAYLPEGSYPTFMPDSKWEIELKRGLKDWHRRIRELLRFSFKDTPNDRFPRKIYMFGGSDAHGDFNYETSLAATILDNKFFRAFGVSGRDISTNAFAKVRTYVNFKEKVGVDNNEKALNALADGNSVITDGPVISFSFDSDVRFNSDSLEWYGYLSNHFHDIKKDEIQKVFNDDGRIGGDGNYDGGFTALVVKGTKHAALTYRWNNSGEFGRRFGGIPHAIQLYLDTPEIHKGPILNRINDKKEIGEINSSLEISPKRPDKNQNMIITLKDVKDINNQNFEVPIVLSMGIFAEKKEANEDYRCYTNPIWIVPVEIKLSNAEVDNGRIAPGKLKIEFKFEMSMTEKPYDVMLSLLDKEGNVTGAPFSLIPDTNDINKSWSVFAKSDKLKISHGVFHVTNENPIILSESKDLQKILVCLRDPQDLHGNKLNSIATVLDLASVKTVAEAMGGSAETETDEEPDPVGAISTEGSETEDSAIVLAGSQVATATTEEPDAESDTGTQGTVDPETAVGTDVAVGSDGTSSTTVVEEVTVGFEATDSVPEEIVTELAGSQDESRANGDKSAKKPFANANREDFTNYEYNFILKDNDPTSFVDPHQTIERFGIFEPVGEKVKVKEYRMAFADTNDRHLKQKDFVLRIRTNKKKGKGEITFKSRSQDIKNIKKPDSSYFNTNESEVIDKTKFEIDDYGNKQTYSVSSEFKFDFDKGTDSEITRNKILNEIRKKSKGMFDSIVNMTKESVLYIPGIIDRHKYKDVKIKDKYLTEGNINDASVLEELKSLKFGLEVWVFDQNHKLVSLSFKSKSKKNVFLKDSIVKILNENDVLSDEQTSKTEYYFKYFSNIKPMKYQPEAQEIRFKKPFDDPYDEISGMAWHGDNLIILPQWKEYQNKETKKMKKKNEMKYVYSVKRKDIESFLKITLDSEKKKPVEYACVPLDDSAIVSKYKTHGIDYDGFEAIVFNGDNVFLLVELKGDKEGGKGSVLIQGIWDKSSGRDVIKILSDPFVRIPPQAIKRRNLQYETLVSLDDEILILHEANGESFNRARREDVGSNPYAYAFKRRSGNLSDSSILITPTDYRLTDATSIDNTDEFWITNFNYNGELAPPNDDKGVVAQLIPFKYDRNRTMIESDIKRAISVSWGEEEQYNWEGIVRLRGANIDGFLVMNDGNPGDDKVFKPHKSFDLGHLVFIPRP